MHTAFSKISLALMLLLAQNVCVLLIWFVARTVKFVCILELSLLGQSKPLRPNAQKFDYFTKVIAEVLILICKVTIYMHFF